MLDPDFSGSPQAFDGKQVFPMHSFIWYGSTDFDGIARIELAIKKEVATDEEGLHLKVADFDLDLKIFP